MAFDNNHCQTIEPLGTFFVSPKQYIVYVIVKDVCSAITEVLLKQYIKVPTVDSQ